MDAPVYEVFLVLHPVSTRLGDLRRALEPLVAESPFLDMDVHHRASSDSALIAIHYDERHLTGDDTRRLADTARGAGLHLVDPTRLSADERRALYEVRVPQFDVVARGLSRVHDAMVVLADRLAVPTGPRATPPDGLPRLDAPLRMVVQVPPLPRLAPRPPTLPPPPGETAIARGKSGRRGTDDDRLSLSLVEQARLARRAAEAMIRSPDLASQTPTPADPDSSVDAAPHLGIHDDETEPLGAPGPSTVEELPPPPFLDVRFLRGSDWLPVRARALSARGAYLVTSAPARLGDTVHVSVSCAGRTALVRGTVYHVTTVDDARSTGASGFAVRFPEYACPARTHLVQVLVAARNAGVTLRPPPSRIAVRFPVRWPVQIATTQASFRAEAYDVSSGGMFVATPRPFEVGTELEFAMPLDLAALPIEGSARITRVLSPSDASGRGMRPGWGVQIVAMTDDNRTAWDAFLGRVRRRTEKRVLVGAAPGRVEELATSLNAAGYTVTSGSDLGLLMRVAELDPCPPDIAVIDADFDHMAAPPGWIEQVFAARQVQCLTVRGDVRRARTMVDRLLLVES